MIKPESLWCATHSLQCLKCQQGELCGSSPLFIWWEKKGWKVFMPPPRWLLMPFPTYPQNWAGYKTRGDAGWPQHAITLLEGEQGTLPRRSFCSHVGENHICWTESWVLRQGLVQGVGLPSQPPRSTQMVPCDLGQGELQLPPSSSPLLTMQ